MVKLSQQLEAEEGRITRTQRQRRKFEVRTIPSSQTPIPQGSLVKSDIQQRLRNAEQNERDVDADRQIEFDKLQARFPHGENIPQSTLQQFNNKWIQERETRTARVRVLRNLNSQMTSRSYINRTILEQSLDQARSQAIRDFEISEREDVRRRKVREEVEVKQKEIDPQTFLKGLIEKGTRTIKRAEGGVSEVTTFEGIGFQKGRIVQVVRSKDTGDIRITELKGKDKGTVLIGEGLSDKEIEEKTQEIQLAELKKRQEEREPFLDIEEVETREKNIVTKINDLLSLGFSKTKDALGSIKIPIFTAGAGTGFITTGTIVKDPELRRVVREGTTAIVEKTFIGDIQIVTPTGFFGTPQFTVKGLPIVQTGIFPELVSDIPEERITDIRELTDFGKEKILSGQRELTESQLEKLGIRTEFDPIFEKEFQARFEDKFGEKIIKGEITFEEAQEKFKESDEAKLVEKRFGEVVKRKKAGKITSESFGLVGLSLAGLGIKLVPETVGELAVESAVIVGAVKVIPAIPSGVITGAEIGFATHGALQLFDPTLTGEKRIIGGVELLVAGSLLGIKALRVLRTPTIKTIKIKAPKLTLQGKPSSIGIEREIIRGSFGGKTISVEKIVFAKGKLSVFSTTGRRTVVSTRWRDILRLDPIYRGVPTAQRGTTYTLRSFRGDFSFSSGSGYQKAFNLLSKSNRALLTTGGETKLISLKGASASQIRTILRFHAPTVREVFLEKGTLKVFQDQAIGQFKIRIDQPVINVDKILGIKTRGARSITKVRDIERFKGVGEGEIITNIRDTITSITKAGRTTTQSIERSLVDVGDIKSSFRFGDTFDLKGGAVVKQKIPFEFQDITSKFVRQQLVPFKREIIGGKEITRIIKAREGRIIIDVDFEKITGISKTPSIITPAKITRTPLSKTFAEDPIEVIKDIIKRTRADSSSSQIGSQVTLQVDQALKSASIPKISARTQLKDLINIKSLTTPVADTSLEVATLSALGLSQIVKTDLKTALKFDLGLKQDLKQDQLIKQLIKQAQPQALRQGQQLKLSEVLKFSPKTIIPIFKEPIIPDFKLPVIPSIAFPFGLPVAEEKKKRKARERSLKQQLAFLPDFTSRALGLDPEILTEKQALKRIKKIQTGFEIRRSVKLLKGIPE